MKPDWNAVARASLDKWDAVAACSSSLRAAYALGKRDSQRWLPIEDAPHREAVLLWWPHWSDTAITGSYWGVWLSSHAISPEGPGPIAWQPLPPPPENTP